MFFDATAATFVDYFNPPPIPTPAKGKGKSKPVVKPLQRGWIGETFKLAEKDFFRRGVHQSKIDGVYNASFVYCMLVLQDEARSNYNKNIYLC